MLGKRLKGWENKSFLVILVILFFYYGYRMFALTPWYDELYTYYYFISRGPVYAAIHWPLPNNHVGYSVLSGFLDLFGNAAVGLRGVSFCCALLNVWLVYRIGRRHLKQGWSLVAVCLYLSMGLVNQLAVQGRGYTLTITCYLTALWMMDLLCTGETEGDSQKRRTYHILFALSLTWGLYTLASSLYWVLPLCLTGGSYLVYDIYQDRRKATGRNRNERGKLSVLMGLIISGLSAAVMTAGLYMILWLAIGSNLLSKDSQSAFLGQDHIKIIISAPFSAMKTGIDYMLATPYIQSTTGENFLSRLYEWVLQLFGYMQNGCSMVILVLLLTGYAMITVKRRKGAERKERFFYFFLFLSILMIPVMLLVQHTLPYHRVFSFLAVPLAFLGAWWLQQGMSLIRGSLGAKAYGGKEKQFGGTVWMAAAVIMTAVFAMVRLFSPEYRMPYGMREAGLQEALEHSDFAGAKVPCVTDCTQQYLIKYLYEKECENQEIRGSDFLLLDRKMTDPAYDIFEWEFYHTYDTIPWDYVENNMVKTYENKDFIVYESNTKRNSSG